MFEIWSSQELLAARAPAQNLYRQLAVANANGAPALAQAKADFATAQAAAAAAQAKYDALVKDVSDLKSVLDQLQLPPAA